MELISVEELITKLKENNINLGKGDPYNRLRYYTKIGLIPHMIRKKNSNNTNSGHYPKDVIDKIIQIENLKNQGLSNEAIVSQLNLMDPKLKIVNEFKNRIKNLGTNFFFIILIIIGVGFEVFRSSSPIENSLNTKDINGNLSLKNANNSGVSFISPGQKKVFISSNTIKQSNTVLVTFRDNIFPATTYHVSEIKDGVGFYVETNLEVSKEVKFNWVIIN